MNRDMLFALKKPCKNCPFLNNGEAVTLQDGRKEDIIEGLLAGENAVFHCHKTVYAANGNNFDKADRYTPNNVSVCAGAAAVARKCGRDMQMVQIAIRLGEISDDHYDEAVQMTIGAADLAINARRARV